LIKLPASVGRQPGIGDLFGDFLPTRGHEVFDGKTLGQAKTGQKAIASFAIFDLKIP
jgi:hypothetical protein